MNQKTTLVAGWFGLTTITLIFSILLIIYLSSTRLVQPAYQNFKLFKSLPAGTSEITDQVTSLDARPKIVENFFKDYNSFLADYASSFVQAADKYNLDYRLLPSIAMQESNGGKRVIKDSKNAFGYGVYGDLVIRFKSWEESIDRVARALREDYLNIGLKTPQQIMTKYTPPSVQKGTWAQGVYSFMVELR